MNDTTTTTTTTTSYALSLTLDRCAVRRIAAKIADELHDQLLEAASDLVREGLAKYGLDMDSASADTDNAWTDLIFSEFVPDAYQAILRASIDIARSNVA